MSYYNYEAAFASTITKLATKLDHKHICTLQYGAAADQVYFYELISEKSAISAYARKRFHFQKITETLRFALKKKFSIYILSTKENINFGVNIRHKILTRKTLCSYSSGGTMQFPYRSWASLLLKVTSVKRYSLLQK